ncbi:hypothetical protein P9112_007912 [Eukaryota sp. TZLM1-RC]
MLQGLEGTKIITDVCNNCCIPLAQSKHKNPLSVADNTEIDKYEAKLLSLNTESHTHYFLCTFALSLHGTLKPLALSFLDNFVETVKQRTGRIFDKFWQNRIAFAICKGIVHLLSFALLSLGRFYEGKTLIHFFLTDLGFEVMEFQFWSSTPKTSP